MSTTVAFISGKGGSGKTSTCIAAGAMLASLGFKVALIDGDTATHGLSYYFLKFTRAAGPSGWLVDPSEKVESLEVREGLHVFPSMVARSEGESDFLLTSVTSSDAINKFRDFATFSLDIDEYDFTFVDCQAGVTEFAKFLVEGAQMAIVVTEADPISISAVAGVRKLLESARNESDDSDKAGPKIYGLVNKVYEDEIEYFKVLTDLLSDISWAGQLPYDLTMRRTVFGRRLPFEEEERSPFYDALEASLGTLFAQVGAVIAEQKVRENTEIARADAITRLEELLEEQEQLRGALNRITDRSIVERPTFTALFRLPPGLASGFLGVMTLSLILYVVLIQNDTTVAVANWVLGVGIGLPAYVLLGLLVARWFRLLRYRRDNVSSSREVIEKFQMLFNRNQSEMQNLNRLLGVLDINSSVADSHQGNQRD